MFPQRWLSRPVLESQYECLDPLRMSSLNISNDVFDIGLGKFNNRKLWFKNLFFSSFLSNSSWLSLLRILPIYYYYHEHKHRYDLKYSKFMPVSNTTHSSRLWTFLNRIYSYVMLRFILITKSVRWCYEFLGDIMIW